MFDFDTLALLFEHIKKNIKTPSYLNYRNNDSWESLSTETFVSSVERLSSAFSAVGVTQGTTVGIISPSSPFWLMVDFALQRIGAVSVPIFTNIASENLQYEIKDAQIRYLFVAEMGENSCLQQIMEKMEYVIIKGTHPQMDGVNILSWEAFLQSADERKDISVTISPSDTATIVYTSGSTGQPKGVVLSHENLMEQVKDAQKAIVLSEKDTALSLLPLAHIFERMVMLYYLACGVRVYFVDDVKKAGPYIKEVRPSTMLVVPRLLEKIYTKMHMNVSEAPLTKRLIAGVAFWWARVRDPDKVTRGFIDRLFDQLVYHKLLEALGGNFRIMISGGAPLSKPISKFFLNIGLPLYQGYGLTECSPVVCVNRVGHNRWGSSGQAFESVEVKLGKEHELLVRGKNVMKGYHNKPKETAAVIDEEGWLHTGDLASIDAEGYITIESRLKELFKTSTGKYVSAIKIESALMHSKWVEYAMVVAEGRPFVTVLLFCDEELMRTLSGREKQQVEQQLSKKIRSLNRHFNKWEHVGGYLVLHESPSVENGLLTPSMKLIRSKVLTKYEEQIDTLYMQKKQGGVM